MKNLIQYTLAATLAAGAAAHSHHQHRHLHAKKEAGSPAQKREADAVTEWVVGATETVYELAGEVLDPDVAAEGLDGGDFVVVGEAKPTYVPPPPPPKPTTTSKEIGMGAQFIEQTSQPPKPKPTKAAPPPPPKPAPEQNESPSSGAGLQAKFPDGKVKCSEFPSKYGALPLDWLNMAGWSGLQFVPDFSMGALSISNIITGIAGEECGEKCMCSYACPPGYQKTQWSEAQGSTKQSIGGLYCNSEGYLELTRKEHDTLCIAGVGGVSIQNDLDVVVSTCQTDYPGTESMVIPSIAQPGSKINIWNPDQDYFIWDGMSTSAQYYVNKKGYKEKDACVWNSPVDAKGAGNWSPIILGVGRAKDGITYISIFQNRPTSNAKLDFNIEIKGDVSSKCSYVNGQWSGGSDGCTTGMRPGGKAIIRYF